MAAYDEPMNLDSSLAALINRQVNNEMFASYSYLAMSAWFETTAFPGFTRWMAVQSNEETAHAMKFYQYLIDRDARVTLEAIAKPQTDFASPLEVFRASLAQERQVTEQIHAIYNAAEDVRDHETRNFLNWFLDEQIEEEKSLRDLIERLEFVGDDPIGLLRLDEEAMARKAVPGEESAGG